MSRDIRSFFTVISKKSGDNSSQSTSKPSKTKSKRVIESDDEDFISSTPEVKPLKKKKREARILSSDSEDDQSKPKSHKKPESNVKPSKKTETKEMVSKLKPINVSDVFNNKPIKQSKVEVIEKAPTESETKEANKSKKSKKLTKIGIHGDPSFEQTLLQLDKQEMKSKSTKLKKQTELGIHNDPAFEQTLLQLDEDDLFCNVDLDKMETEALQNQTGTEDFENPQKPSSTSEKKRNRSDSSSERKETPKKPKLEHTDSGIDPDEEAHERRRYSAMLYQKYLNRSGPKHHGTKEIPEGKPDCLKNLCFLRTGVLDSLESEEFDSLVKRYGGRTVHAVSRKVNYVVVGEEAGPSKLAKAESFNIPKISEDELFDMILVKSGKDPKYCKKDAAIHSEDLGIGINSRTSSSDNFDLAVEEISKKEKSPETKPKLNKEKKENDTETRKTLKEKLKENAKTVSKHKSDKKISDESKKLKDCGPKLLSDDKPSTSREISNLGNKEKFEVDPSDLLTEKYKPTNLRSIIGQQGEESNVNKLKKWLESWQKNQDPKVRKTIPKPSPWAKKDDGAYFKCALLSGPPGVGKTTTATLVAKELGLDIVEFNASDTRSKKLLHEEVAQLLSTKTIAGFAVGQPTVNKKRVLLMDEVDGMAGNEDRGGIQELIQLIKTANIPIICMCNDRNHPKIRSLVNYCFDLKFVKPKLEQIKGAMMSVCFKEGLTISPNALSEIISGTGCDVRQTLNHLSIWAATGKTVSAEEAEKQAKNSKKDTVMGPWEVCRAVFTESLQKDTSVADKARLFFYDYSIGPLFVQENYLKVQPKGNNKKKALLRAAFAADSISMGDIVGSKIRSTNNWSLLESQAFFSSVLPGHYMSGQFAGRIEFPSWLGKNSKKNKFSRMLTEIQIHTRTSASASKLAVKLDYLIPLRNAILLPLKKRGMDGISQAVNVMKTYSLLREDLDNLVELTQWKHGQNLMNGIETKVKSAFTRTYNKEVTLLPYAPGSGVSKRKATAENDLLGLEEEEVIESDQDDDDITKNAMIKVKKPSTKGKKTIEEAGPSKKTESKKGKGKKTK